MRVGLFLVVLSFGLSGFSATQSEVLAKYELLNALPVTQSVLSKVERHEVFRQASDNPVASLDSLAKYDPTDEIGFCFGRAMTVHLIARKHGLAPEAIRKLFVIGDLRSGENPEWRFHVTTAVLGEDKRWYAIDPIMTAPIAPGTAMPVEDWINVVQNIWDRKKQARFYWVDSPSITPDIRTVPDVSQETGERIIEISFNPRRKDGFKRIRLGSKIVFAVSGNALAEHFLRTDEKDEEAFPFHELTINGSLKFHFGSYFEDLMADLTQTRKTVRSYGPMAGASDTFSPRVFSSNRSVGLGSPRLTKGMR